MAGAVVLSKLAAEADAVRLAVSTSARLTDLIYSAPAATVNRVVRNEITGLDPDTEYWYTLEIDGALRISNIGRFKTKPEGPASFKFGFASCQLTDANHPVYDWIYEQDILFFLNIGDRHYLNIAVNDEAVFEAAYDTVLANPRQARIYRLLPHFYMHDDHDYGPNDSAKNSPSRAASLASFRRRVPHPPLVLNEPGDPVYFKFEVGRVVFFVLDLRSDRDPNNTTDNASKSMMGAAQKAWLKSQLIASENEGKLLVIVSSSNWIQGATTDTWGVYSTERTELHNFFHDNGLTDRLCILCGDRHSIAIDDGTNSGYGTAGVGAVPVFRAAPIHHWNRTSGGTWSEGTYVDNENQFGVMEVTDTGGDTVTVDWRGYAYGEGELVHFQFAADLAT